MGVGLVIPRNACADRFSLGCIVDGDMGFAAVRFDRALQDHLDQGASHLHRQAGAWGAHCNARSHTVEQERKEHRPERHRSVEEVFRSRRVQSHDAPVGGDDRAAALAMSDGVIEGEARTVGKAGGEPLGENLLDRPFGHDEPVPVVFRPVERSVLDILQENAVLGLEVGVAQTPDRRSDPRRIEADRQRPGRSAGLEAGKAEGDIAGRTGVDGLERYQGDPTTIGRAIVLMQDVEGAIRQIEARRQIPRCQKALVARLMTQGLGDTMQSGHDEGRIAAQPIGGADRHEAWADADK